MKNSAENKFNLSKRVRLLGKIVGYNTAFNLVGSKKLGQGAFGTVYSSRGAAVKVAHAKGQKELKHEVSMLEQLKGLKIAPQLLGSGKGYAAIQQFKGNTLNDSGNLKRIKEDPVFADYIFRKIVEAMGALHRKNIAQKDLHAGNIFITDDYQVKILDYGQASKGYPITYYETFFGSNYDPKQGAIGLIHHLFLNTQSYKTYKRILINAIRIICKKKGISSKIALQNYEAIEGNEEKETEYFNVLENLARHPENDQSDVSNFYSALDTALKINTKNPLKTKRVSSKTRLLSTSSTTARKINQKYSLKGTIPQASEGGVFSGPESGYPVILHGTEAVVPLDDLNIPPARYIQGQAGVWELEFESVLDHAIYFAGKSPFPKGAKQAEILDWLQDTLGITWKDISEHRDKIMDTIRQLTPDAWEGGNYPYLHIPRVDPDFEIETYADADEEEPDDLDDLLNEIRDEDEDEDEAEGLDELLDLIRDTSVSDTEEKETEKKIEQANDIAEDIQIDPDVLSDLPPSLQASLVKVINRKTGATINAGDKKETTSAITNTKIYRFLTNNLLKIEGQLDSINASIKEQNILLQTNLDLNLKTLQSVEEQDALLERKLDTILDLYTNQTSLIKKYEEDLKRQATEARLEQQRDSAFTTGFTDVGGHTLDSNSLLGRLVKFFGKKIAVKLWKFLPLAIRSRAKLLGKALRPGKLLGKVAQRIAAKKAADKATQKATQKFVAKGFEHIALPALKSADNVAAKGVQKSGGNLLQRALSSSVVQKALVKKLGKEGAEKLTVKLAAKLIPGVATAYGLGEGLARIMMGDVKGGFLSFGSAIPVAGYGFAAVDVLRDIDVAAYTKHIEGPAMSGKLGDEQFAAFIAEALGVTENQYETGTLSAKPGVAMLHGTELIVDKNQSEQMNPMAIVGGSLLAATTNYINSMGPLAASIAPTFKQVAAPIAEEYGIPKTFTQTKVGGALPNLSQELKRIKDKRKQTPEEELEGIEKDLLETQNSESFAEKLLKILDPQGRFQELLKNINNRPTPTVDGDSLMAEGGYAVEASDVGDKFGDRGGKHKGIDIASSKFKMGTPISIIKPGVVEDIGKLSDGTGDPGGWGNFVVVKHDDGLYSLYGHLSEVNATKGQRLEPSANGVFPVIGKIGSTGRSSGAHLHLEVGTGWTGGTLKGHINPLPIVNQLMRGGGNIRKVDRPTGTPVKVEGLGKQGVMANKNFGSTSGVGSKGYLIVPGHAAGGGAPGEAALVKQLAQNAYSNLKQKYPDANIKYVDVNSMFEDTEAGFNKQKQWYKKMEQEGWEVLEVHMDASMESGQGSGRGVIVPKGELNAVEKHFAENFGAFPRGHRDLAAPNRGASIFELGNMSPELQRSVQSGQVTKQQLDALTSPFERSIAAGLNLQSITPPSGQRQRFESMQGKDKDAGTKHLIVNQATRPAVGGQGSQNITFVPMGSGRWRTENEYSDTIRSLIMSRLR
jgi:murein DD-endopeptidase MepM/ murein hydrolase activator NlpD/serine/threonine protein kinase